MLSITRLPPQDVVQNDGENGNPSEATDHGTNDCASTSRVGDSGHGRCRGGSRRTLNPRARSTRDKVDDVPVDYEQICRIGSRNGEVNRVSPVFENLCQEVNDVVAGVEERPLGANWIAAPNKLLTKGNLQKDSPGLPSSR